MPREKLKTDPIIDEYVEQMALKSNWSKSYKLYTSSILNNMRRIIDVDIKDIEYGHINAFIHLKKETESWSNVLTMRNSIDIIKRLFRHLVKKGVITESPAEKIAFPKWRGALAKMNSNKRIDKKYRAMKKVVDSNMVSDKHRAIWHIAASGVVSSNDILNIKKKDLELIYSRINTPNSKKLTLIPLTAEACKAIKRYLLKDNSKSEYLFHKRDGGKLCDVQVCDTLNSICFKIPKAKKHGINSHTTLKTLRKASMVHYIESGADLLALLYQIGGKSLQILDGYTPLSPKRMVKLMKEHRKFQKYRRKRRML